jgi:hypothetical protein
MAAAKLVTTKLGSNRYSKGSSIDLPTAAKMLNVSDETVKRAKKVLEKGTPELVALVERGQVAASTAGKVAEKVPKAEQAELVQKGTDAVREKAKSLTTRRTNKTPAQLKKQIDNFLGDWDELNGSQKRHFVKTNRDELGELLQELEALEDAEYPEAEETSPAAS